VTLLTAAGPYAEMIELGQRRMNPEIMNISAMGGFAFADAATCGLSVVVTARRDKRAAEMLAREIAELGWANRARFYPRLTSLEDAVARAQAAGHDPSLPALAFADVADNPGGGGRGNTVFLLRAFYEAGVDRALLGVIYDPDLAADAHRRGIGSRFEARFNRAETTNFSEPYTASATVLTLTDGRCVGRRGIYAGMRLELGPCAARPDLADAQPLHLDPPTPPCDPARRGCGLASDPRQYCKCIMEGDNETSTLSERDRVEPAISDASRRAIGRYQLGVGRGTR
jgi:microcystin degradation protein MlrC